MRLARLVLAAASVWSALGIGRADAERPREAWVCNFAPGSAVPDAECRRLVADFAAEAVQRRQARRAVGHTSWGAWMLMLPDIMVTVAGHMDGAEAARGLDGLDQRRAEAVAALVEARRLPTATISITAHGATLPLLAGHARAAQNRRVEVRLAFAPLREPTPPAGWRPGG